MRRIAAINEIRSRAKRTRFLPSYLFADPAWDILLDLYRSGLAQQRVSVSSLCTASNVPATTALRWIKTLQNEGLIDRAGDPLDARRHFVRLTDAGRTAMDGFFTSETVAPVLPIAA